MHCVTCGKTYMPHVFCNFTMCTGQQAIDEQLLEIITLYLYFQIIRA